MQDLEVLKKRGLTAEELRKKFETETPSDKIKSLLETHRNRIQKAIEQNINEAPFYHAIDAAVDASRKNLPHIQARELADRGKKDEEIVKNFKLLGIENLLDSMIEPDGTVSKDHSGQPIKCFNIPVFEKIFVPLVASYRNIRLAKLFNDRNVYPRYKYSPARMTVKDMIVSEIITQRISRMTSEMGYGDDDKQAMRQMLDYGFSITFSREPYYRESYYTEEDGKEVKKVLREGVRFTTPHPTRVFFDRLSHLASLNSDTGITYCGFWDICRYRDIRIDPVFWNKDKITYSNTYPFLTTGGWTIYQELYPCSVKFPVVDACGTSGGAGDDDRLNNYGKYTSADDDAAVTRVVMFEKLKPSEWDLGDYDEPVWIKFIYADTGTIIHAEPIAYTPGFVMLYDYDFNRVLNTTLALDLTPFQQLLGNFLTQHFLSVKRNLLRLAWVNNDLVPKEQVDMIVKQGDKIYTNSVTFLNYKKGMDMVVQQDRRDAVIPFSLGQVPTNEIANSITMLLSVVERMLGYSPQEVGASATHEITAAEANITNFNTGVRTEFIGSGVDTGINAKKRILYEAVYVYGSDEVFSEVADLTPEREAALKELNFEIESKPEDKQLNAGVKGKKAALKLQSFVAEREGINRVNDARTGVAMMQMLGVAMQNQELFQRLGTDQFIILLNYVLRMMGLPEDFRLKATGKVMQAGFNPEEIKQALTQAAENIKNQAVEESVKVMADQIKKSLAEPMAQEMKNITGAITAIAQRGQQVEQAVVQLNEKDQMIEGALLQMKQAIEQLAAANAAEHAAIANAQPTGFAAAPGPGIAPMA